jgi:hypothetical protein
MTIVIIIFTVLALNMGFHSRFIFRDDVMVIRVLLFAIPHYNL